MKDKFLDNSFYITILFFPIVFVLGNAAINIAIALSVVFSTILIFKKKYLYLYKQRFFILSILFCFFIIISSLLNYEISKIDKSILYLRYPFFSLSVIFFYLYFDQKKINFFYKFNFTAVLILIIDFIFQIFTKKNILGFEARCSETSITELNQSLNDIIVCDRYSGMFNDEFIMGMYLLFFVILILNIYLYLNKKLNYIFVINIFIGILILKSGEKANFLSFIIFIFFFSLYFIKKYNFRKILYTLAAFLIGTFILIKFDNSVYARYVHFYELNLKSQPGRNFGYQIYSSPWFIHYRGATAIYKDNLIFGSGMKSFRKICKDYDYVLTDKEIKLRDYRVCSTHPHNMYIEVLSESGTITFIIFMILICYALVTALKRKNFIDYFIFCLLLSYFFPFKPTGSLYSTITASLFWYLISLPYALENFKKRFYINE